MQKRKIGTEVRCVGSLLFYLFLVNVYSEIKFYILFSNPLFCGASEQGKGIKTSISWSKSSYAGGSDTKVRLCWLWKLWHLCLCTFWNYWLDLKIHAITFVQPLLGYRGSLHPQPGGYGLALSYWSKIDLLWSRPSYCAFFKESLGNTKRNIQIFYG